VHSDNGNHQTTSGLPTARITVKHAYFDLFINRLLSFVSGRSENRRRLRHGQRRRWGWRWRRLLVAGTVTIFEYDGQCVQVAVQLDAIDWKRRQTGQISMGIDADNIGEKVLSSGRK
jgi:hypothetical protein